MILSRSFTRTALFLGTIALVPNGVFAQAPATHIAGLPVYFVANAGQFTPDVDYAATTRHYVATFGEHVRLTARDPRARVALEFPGGILGKPRASQPLDGRVHYLMGAAHETTNVPTFGRVKYEQVYRGIDVEFYPKDGSIEYDFIVAPGVDPSAARIAFRGADRIRLTREGDLLIDVGGAELRQPRPTLYQEIQGRRRIVGGHYRVGADNVVGFEIGSYDTTRPLVIDPTLTFSTFFGGNNEELIADVAVDGAGNIYVTGATASTNLATAGAYNTTFARTFVAKLDPSGTRMVYATYINGGTFSANMRAIAVDSAGNAYVTGDTISPDFPTTTGAYDRTCGRDGNCEFTPDRGRVTDAFVLKLNAAGSALAYSTYIGGSGGDSARDIGVDAAGRAHIAGITDADYPVTAGAFMVTGPGGSNGFHSTLNASGTALAYSTYIGGSGGDNVQAIAVRPDGRRAVTGWTDSHDFRTFMAVKSENPSSFTDAFAVAFNATGIVSFSTYLGGSNYEFTNGAAMGDDGSVYVAGSTYSDDIPNMRTYGPVWPRDAWITRLSADGQRIIYTTRVGGSSYEDARTMVVDEFGRALVGVLSGSPDFPPTADAFQRQPKQSDAHLIALLPTGELAYSTRLGGKSNDEVIALAHDGGNGVVLTGFTTSSDFPVRNGIGPRAGFGTGDAVFDSWLAKFAFEPPAPPPPPPGGGGGTGNPREIVLYAHKATLAGAWRVVADTGAADSQAVWHPNANAAKLATPLASPSNYIELTFTADAGVNYRLWLRGKADANSWANDSVYAQFSDSVDSAGAASWRIGTTSGTAVQIERCSNCGVQGWGWNDNGWGSTGVDVMGPTVRFATTGEHTIRLQTREDGLRVDQVVLSAATYMNAAPGAAKNDATILTESDGAGGGGGEDDPVCSPRELVLHAADATVAGAWRKVADSAAASGIRVTHPNAGAAKVNTALAAPANYVELRFFAEANVDYRFWMRGLADANHWSNDSAFVQFSDSVTAAGAATWRIGTTSATTYTLENCTGCPVAGWGWNDNDYGGWQLGVPVRFATTGMHTIRLQTREDGLSFDQIVLSAERYFETAPGTIRQDTTKLDRCATPAPSTTP